MEINLLDKTFTIGVHIFFRVNLQITNKYTHIVSLNIVLLNCKAFG